MLNSMKFKHDLEKQGVMVEDFQIMCETIKKYLKKGMSVKLPGVGILSLTKYTQKCATGIYNSSERKICDVVKGKFRLGESFKKDTEE